MDEIISRYKTFLRNLEEEYETIGAAWESEESQKYKQLLKNEIEKVQSQLYLFYK